MNNVDLAIAALRSKKPVLIYDADGREEETDITMPSQFVMPETIRTMRKDGGGLICTTVPSKSAKLLNLPYLVDLFSSSGMKIFKDLYPNDIPYDTKSAFSITINHRKTFTGISDIDRALTISEFAKIVELSYSGNGYASVELARNFRSPGHVTLLIASHNLLKDRQGHTELSTALVAMAGLVPTATIVEMMGSDGKSLSKSEAIKYAKEHNLVFIEGKEIIGRWNGWSV